MRIPPPWADVMRRGLTGQNARHDGSVARKVSSMVMFRAGLFKARLSYPRVSENFDFSLATFWRGVLFIFFALQFSAVGISNYTKY